MITSVVVWVLVLAIPGYRDGNVIVVDNIVAESNCRALGRQIAREQAAYHDTTLSCLPVRKRVVQ